MYGYQNIPPPWMWPQGPSTTTAPQDPVTLIEGWIKGLEAVKRLAKDEKKDDPKKPKGAEVSAISMMLFMLLISPVTAPAMYHFFQLSLGLLR